MCLASFIELRVRSPDIMPQAGSALAMADKLGAALTCEAIGRPR
jgi:hypothetical protein